MLFLQHLDYSQRAMYFAQLFYQKGLLVKYLNNETIHRLNKSYIENREGAEGYVKQTIINWNENKISKETMSYAFMGIKKHLEGAIKIMSEVKTSLQDEIN